MLCHWCRLRIDLNVPPYVTHAEGHAFHFLCWLSWKARFWQRPVWEHA